LFLQKINKKTKKSREGIRREKELTSFDVKEKNSIIRQDFEYNRK